MTSFLPPTPKPRLNLAARLFVDPKTEAKLRWSLFHDVDPASEIDGKPLLQVFCEHHKHNSYIGSTHHFKTDPLPTHPGEAWPDPRVRAPDDNEDEGEWPNVDMWIAAHLICNGPDPFAWKSEDGRDVLDFAIQFRNPLLLDQLLRMPSAPSIEDLQMRKVGPDKMDWLHALCENGARAQNLEVLLHHGWDVDRLDLKKRTALFFARNPDQVNALLDAGADPLLTDKDKLSIRQAWAKRAFSPTTQNSRNGFYAESDLIKQLNALDDFCVKLNPDKVLPQVSTFLFEATLKSKNSIFAVNASRIYGVPMHAWTKDESGNTWSLPGYMAFDSVNKKKSAATSCAINLSVESSPVEWERESIPGISDIALLWMATLSYGDDISQSTTKVNRLLASLDRDTNDLNKTWHHIWRHAIELDHHFEDASGKFKASIATAWEREIDLVMQNTLNVLKPNPLSATPRSDAFLSDPSIMLDMAKMPISQRQLGAFNSTIEALALTEDGRHIDLCFKTAAELAVNPIFDGEMKIPHAEILQKLIKIAPHWTPDPDDDLSAWSKIDEMAKGDKNLGAISSWMTKNFLNVHTQSVGHVRARARL